MLAACSSFALGQAIPGATRLIDVQAGGTFTFAYPDYTPQNALGYGIYGTFDFTPHWGAELDFHQVDILQHSPAKETTFEYGVRYRRYYGRYVPYLKGLGGRGTFGSNPFFYQGNNSLGYNILTFGAGVDTPITTRINLRVGMEYQHWFTGGVTGAEGVGGPGSDVYLPHGLTPILYEVGVAYHFTGNGATQ
jgi:hypothetical protein